MFKAGQGKEIGGEGLKHEKVRQGQHSNVHHAGILHSLTCTLSRGCAYLNSKLGHVHRMSSDTGRDKTEQLLTCCCNQPGVLSLGRLVFIHPIISSTYLSVAYYTPLALSLLGRRSLLSKPMSL